MGRVQPLKGGPGREEDGEGEGERGHKRQKEMEGVGKTKSSTTSFSFKILNCNYRNPFSEPSPPIPLKSKTEHTQEIYRGQGKKPRKNHLPDLMRVTRPHPHHPSMAIEQIY